MKLPLDLERIIDISDPVYTFCDVMDHIDLKKYFVEEGCKTGCPRCDSVKLDEMKVPSFATFGNFIRNELTTSVEEIFKDINKYIFEVDNVRKLLFWSLP